MSNQLQGNHATEGANPGSAAPRDEYQSRTHSSLITHYSALVAAVGDGVGCEHWTVPDHGLPVALLAAMGLVRPIATRVPRCSEHGCRYLGVCAQQVVFEEGRQGRANRKFRLTAEGRAAAADSSLLVGAAASLPLAETILAALADGERSVFELVWSLVERQLAAVSTGADDAASAVPTRAYLHAALTLLAEGGYLELDEASGIVRRPRDART